jgi:general secretion pathway protein F
MQYDVRALTADHLITQLSVDAANEDDARRQVEARGLFAAAITPARPSLFAGAGKTRRLSLVLFSQELLALLNAGLSIVEGLEALLEKEPSEATRSILTRLLSGLREGKRFSQVLADQSDLFPPLYIGIVKAAEGTSDLPRSLARYIDYQQRIDTVRSKIISAAIYPVILLCVGGAVTFFLVGYVVPRFAEVYQGAGRNLPWLSQMLLEWGQFATTRTKTLLFGIAVCVSLLVVTFRHFPRKAALPASSENCRASASVCKSMNCRGCT